MKKYKIIKKITLFYKNNTVKNFAMLLLKAKNWSEILIFYKMKLILIFTNLENLWNIYEYDFYKFYTYVKNKFQKNFQKKINFKKK